MTFIFLADFYHPFAEDEIEQSTTVQILFPSEPPVSFQILVDQYSGYSTMVLP